MFPNCKLTSTILSNVPVFRVYYPFEYIISVTGTQKFSNRCYHYAAYFNSWHHSFIFINWFIDFIDWYIHGPYVLIIIAILLFLCIHTVNCAQHYAVCVEGRSIHRVLELNFRKATDVVSLISQSHQGVWRPFMSFLEC